MESFHGAAPEESLSIIDRLPDYAATFTLGLVVSALIGFAVWVISDIPLSSTVGYALMLYGVIFLLAGGSTGGGYTNLGMGALGSLTRTGRTDELQESEYSERKPTPRERLDKGLRPEANPRAFWQVIGGCLYLGLGLLIVSVFG